MRRGHAILALLAIAIGGCREPTGKADLIASISIQRNSVPFEEQTIPVNGSLHLTAVPLDAAGRPTSGAVEWSSSNPAVASVDGSGVVRGLQVGSTWIHARAGKVADSARVNVSVPFTGPAACEPGQAPLSLSVGQVHQTTGWDTPTLCLSGGTEGAEYVLIPYHASAVAGGALGTRLTVEIAPTGTTPPAGPLQAGSAMLERVSAGVETGGRPDEEFHLRLRERAAAELTPRLRRMRNAAPAALLSTARAVPREGDILQLNVRSDSACASPHLRAARVMAVTQRAVVVADTQNPSGGFTAEEYRNFGNRFDDLVYPVAVQNFGEPHDLDGNQRVIVFFTRAVNDLTRAGQGYYVAGFFYDRDLFLTSGSGACAGSNQAEILYLMVPDPQRAATHFERVFEKEHVARRTLSVTGHEMQHLINASRRLHVNKASIWEEVWLNEGLSHVMEELLFYRESGLQPRANLSAAELQAAAARRAFAEYQLDNFERLLLYLSTVEQNSLMAGSDLAMRGAAWSFLRYAADRRGGAERELWFRLANSRSSGIANLREALGQEPLGWISDWTVSLLADDLVLPVESRFTFPSWNVRNLTPTIRAMLGQQNFGYPLRVTPLQSGTGSQSLTTAVSLQSSAAAYYRFGVAAGGPAAIRVTSGGLQAPRKLKLSVVRTR